MVNINKNNPGYNPMSNSDSIPSVLDINNDTNLDVRKYNTSSCTISAHSEVKNVCISTFHSSLILHPF